VDGEGGLLVPPPCREVPAPRNKGGLTCTGGPDGNVMLPPSLLRRLWWLERSLWLVWLWLWLWPWLVW
jgi:hypothetical protein